MQQLAAVFSKKRTQVIRFLKSLKWWHIVLVALAILILLQQFIPTGLIAAGSKLDNQAVGFKTTTTVAKTLETNAAVVKLDFQNAKTEVATSAVGIAVHHEDTVSQLNAVSQTDKFIPFAPLFKLFSSSNVQSVTNVDKTKKQQVAKALAEKYSSEPKDAQAVITDGALVIQKAVPGKEFTPEKIVGALEKIQPYQNEIVKPDGKEIKPTVTEAAFDAMKKKVANISSKKLKVSYGDTQKEITAEVFTKWLEVAQLEDKSYVVVFKDEAMQSQLDEYAKEYNIAAGVTQITTVDGEETARVQGAAGRAIDAGAAKQQLQEWLVQPDDEAVALKTMNLSPRAIYTRIFSASSAGLQAKIDAWIKENGGSGKYQVAIQELGGQGRRASYNVSQQTVMASTYKLFLAYAAYSQSENGALNLTTQLSCGKNIHQAIEVMIVNSDNDCAIALGKHIGWAKVDQIIASSGFKNVKLNNYNGNGTMAGDKMVNAGELAKFLAQLSAGSLMNSNNTGTLLNHMKRQDYRQGIPAGSRGAVVADKVGFLEGYLHDAGIVYGTNSTYALVIMSDGSSWNRIGDLSRAIYDFMNE